MKIYLITVNEAKGCTSQKAFFNVAAAVEWAQDMECGAGWDITTHEFESPEVAVAYKDMHG
jgi:hypothetical protein